MDYFPDVLKFRGSQGTPSLRQRTVQETQAATPRSARTSYDSPIGSVAYCRLQQVHCEIQQGPNPTEILALS